MIKNAVKFLFSLLISLAYTAYKIEGVNALLLIMPAKLIVPTLRKYGARIGENAILHSPLIIHNAGENYKNLILGNNVYLGRAVFLDLKDKILIHDRVTVSMRVTVLTHTDAGESRAAQKIPVSQKAVEIHSDVYIGANATLSEGVKIGERAVVGACSLVRHSVAPDIVVAGIPAKEIKKVHG